MTLLEPAKHTRFTGQTVSLIRLCVLTIIQDGTLPHSTITALSPLSTPVEWTPPSVWKLVIPTKKKLLQTKLRRSRNNPPQMPSHDDQVSLPIWRTPGCPLESADHGDWWTAYYREHRSTRVVSLNVGPVGLRNTMHTMERIIRTNTPGIVLLQDCRVREIDKDTMLRTVGAAFPEYSFALACSRRTGCAAHPTVASTTPVTTRYRSLLWYTGAVVPCPSRKARMTPPCDTKEGCSQPVSHLQSKGSKPFTQLPITRRQRRPRRKRSPALPPLTTVYGLPSLRAMYTL
jgi:hypothetical protein